MKGVGIKGKSKGKGKDSGRRTADHTGLRMRRAALLKGLWLIAIKAVGSFLCRVKRLAPIYGQHGPLHAHACICVVTVEAVCTAPLFEQSRVTWLLECMRLAIL